MSSFSLSQTRQVFQPGIKLKILIVHSCHLSKPTVAQVSFGVGIFRCENAFFSQTGETLKRVRNAFQPRSERECSVRLFLSSTEYVPTYSYM